MRLLPNNQAYYVHSTNVKFRDMIWHNRMIHLARLEKTTKLINGMTAVYDVPKKHYWMYTSANLPKAARNNDSASNPATPFQKLRMDFGFTAQKSKNINRLESLKGGKGETCYLTIKDTLISTKHREDFIDKTPPTQWLRFFLEKHASNKATTKIMKIRDDTGG